MPQVNLNGQSITYTVRTSKRAKRIILRYNFGNGLEVVYPLGQHEPSPEELLQERSDWVLSAIDKFRETQAISPRRAYREGEEFLFRGATYGLALERDSLQKRIRVRLTDDSLALSLPDPKPGGEVKEIRKAIEHFYRRQAQNYLPPRVRALAEIYGFAYENLRIKNQKTRWGSCSVKRNINLNLRLMMAPDDAIDYVIIHELCHLREMSHSPAFWALVESYCPEYRHWKAWFKRHGLSLVL